MTGVQTCALPIFKNTLQLKTILISESLLSEVRQRRDLSVLSDPYEVTFDPDGNLPPWRAA